MSGLNLKAALFYRPEEVAEMFRREGNLRWVYRHAAKGGFLAPHARRFGKTLLFSREGIDRLVDGKENDGA
jgi:hypothetical protein